ncbi:MAG: TIGR03960 family B12-binding radical SAM protein [Chloroflexi bacterium]|nr:TIGR03960 family B12-binding radical SAM protein [Chloroflexota bacterium]
MMTPHQIEQALDRVLLSVLKPGRYSGGEHNQIAKDWARIDLRVALGFPDIYDLGMSNLGLAILYKAINDQPDMLAERAYCPWLDMEAAMRREGIPLYSLETKHALADFDLIGLTLPYEQLHSNVLNFLELAQLPLRAADRDETHPLVIAGGHACYNPEPMADFIDAFLIGEGEEAIVDVARCIQQWKREGKPGGKEELLNRVAAIDGFYVPSFYSVDYHSDGTIARVTPARASARFPVLKRIVPMLPPPVTRFIVPFVDITHNRAPIEIMRGCTRGCRFCHAGMVTRPVRERPVEEVVEAVGRMIRETGFEQIALLSLSSSDYTRIGELVKAIGEKYANENLDISLPSLRIESFSVDLMDALKDARRSGFTLAPEAATERMREIINKPISTEQVLTTAREIYSRGWHTIKLYFMIGHPMETLDDVRAIAELCKAVLAEGKKVLGKRAQVNAGVSTFVPKPHTPFQWAKVADVHTIREKQAILKRELRGPGLKLNWNNPEETQLEAWFSRGDRRLGKVLLEAHYRGAKFDAWMDMFDMKVWRESFAAAGLDLEFYNGRERAEDEIFPWDHIDAAVKKKFLLDDWRWSKRGQTRVDCRDHCFACGILPKFKDLRRETPDEAWECPVVTPIARRGQLLEANIIPLTLVQP